MVLRIGERLGRCNNNTLASMNAQRIEILHITHGDAIVVTVTHHLVLYLLPTLQRLLHQHLRREGEGFFSQTVQLFLVVAEARPQPA